MFSKTVWQIFTHEDKKYEDTMKIGCSYSSWAFLIGISIANEGMEIVHIIVQICLL